MRAHTRTPHFPKVVKPEGEREEVVMLLPWHSAPAGGVQLLPGGGWGCQSRFAVELIKVLFSLFPGRMNS